MNELISVQRCRPSSTNHGTVLSATQSDRARLIYSAAFRRLQQKAQVFSLESNSSVRSRLTHSIEVSHIGRYIVATIFELLLESDKINEEDKEYWKKHSLAISNVVETACLMHDIGNPPFGHFGEAAIKEWAISNDITRAIRESLKGKYSDSLKDTLLSDFVFFDGNPQGFRILTRLQGEDGFYGLNLTNSQLAAFFKYTCCPDNRNSNKPFSKKIGYFNSEKNIVNKICGDLKMGVDKRHPLSFIMEASDDISYCISDIEDGLEKKVISIREFSEFTIERLRNLTSKYPDEDIFNKLIKSLEGKSYAPIGIFLSFKTDLSNYLVRSVSNRFVDDYYHFISFSCESELICKNTVEYDLLEILKDYTSTFLFTSKEAECMELSGFAIISGILNSYTKLLSLSKEHFSYLILKDLKNIRNNKLDIERRLFNRLPNKHIDAYKASVVDMSLRDEKCSGDYFKDALAAIELEKEWHFRAHLLVDFVSGMTDQFAMDMYQLLKGIKVK